MIKWLKAAAEATSVAQACKNSDTMIAEYFQGRVVDSEFDAACRIFDQIVELRIVEKVRQQAQSRRGPRRKLVFRLVRRPAFGPDFPSLERSSAAAAAARQLPSCRGGWCDDRGRHHGV